MLFCSLLVYLCYIRSLELVVKATVVSGQHWRLEVPGNAKVIFAQISTSRNWRLNTKNLSFFFSSTDTDYSYYNLILKKAGQFLSNFQINLLKFALSIRAYSPTVQMFQQVYSRNIFSNAVGEWFMWYFGFRVNNVYYCNSVICMLVFFAIKSDLYYKRHNIMFYKLVLLCRINICA